jgi:hypothetical protein
VSYFQFDCRRKRPAADTVRGHARGGLKKAAFFQIERYGDEQLAYEDGGLAVDRLSSVASLLFGSDERRSGDIADAEFGAVSDREGESRLKRLRTRKLMGIGTNQLQILPLWGR